VAGTDAVASPEAIRGAQVILAAVGVDPAVYADAIEDVLGPAEETIAQEVATGATPATEALFTNDL